ncbi:MAG TPA: hypothetical protein VEP90_14380, partial [Methylomirabilota bacterium]|nr:hypothetical protein [Methylomirabilota bacterium]
VIVDGKLQKDYAIAYLSSNRRVLGIKAKGFAANTPMFLGGNEDLEHLASKNMNIRAMTEEGEINQETQGKFRVKETRESTRDYLRSKSDYKVHFRDIEVAFDSNATDEEKNSTGSKYFPLESGDPHTYNSRSEMKGLVVLDFDDFKSAEGLNRRSTRRAIKEGLIHYCREMKAIEDDIGDRELYQFITSESSDVFVADFKAYLARTSKPAESQDVRDFVQFR